MESNNKKWSQRRLSKEHFVRQAEVIKKIEAITGKIPQDDEYIVDLFLEQFMLYSSEDVDKWSELMIDYIQNAFYMWNFEKVDLLLEKIDIENLWLLQMECLLRNCFRCGKKLKNYHSVVTRVFNEVHENYSEYMYIFQWIFSFENGELKIYSF